MRAVALIILYSFAAYLIGFGLVALLDRRRVFRFLRKFAQTGRANAIEASCRVAVGLAFVSLAPALPAAAAIVGFGAILIVSAIAMLAFPDYHRRFADRVVPGIERAIPLIGIVSLGMGGILVFILRPLTALGGAPY